MATDESLEEVMLMLVAAAAAITLSAGVVVLITGTIIPLVTALITKAHAPSWVKTWSSVVLAAIAGILAPLAVTGGDVTWQTFVVTIVGAIAVQAATYQGFWKPSGIIAKIQGIAPNVGIGPQQKAA